MEIDLLKKEYLINKKGIPKIAEEYKCSSSYLYSLLRKHEVKRRGPAGRILIDYSGKQYGQWTVIQKHESKNSTWICKCSCGVEKPVKSSVFLKCGKCNNCTKTGFGEITGTRWSNIKNGGIQRGLEFSITVKEAWELFLNQNRKCALTGKKIWFAARKKRNPTRSASNASLDRIDSNKGYVSGNIQWVLKSINMMKQGLDQQEFINLCKEVSKHNE